MCSKSIVTQLYRIRNIFRSDKKSQLECLSPNELTRINEIFAKENAETTPPDDETIKKCCVWGIEIYTPTHFNKLVEGLEKIGWSDQENTGGFNDPVEWLRDTRHTIGKGPTGSAEARFEEPRRFRLKESRSLRLPQDMKRGTLRIFSISPSMVAVIGWFDLTDEGSRRFDEALRTHRSFGMKPPRGRGSHYSVKSQKYDHIDQIRSEIGSSLSKWFREHLPGMFTSGPIEEELPTCEFVTFRSGEPLTPKRVPEVSSDEYMEILGLRYDPRAWTHTRISGLKLALPGYRMFAPKFHLLAAINESSLTNQTVGGENKNINAMLMRRIDDNIGSLLCAWSVVAMLDGYTRYLVQVRDTAIHGSSVSDDISQALGTLEHEIAYSSDIATVAAELSNLGIVKNRAIANLRSFKLQSTSKGNSELNFADYIEPQMIARCKEAVRNEEANRNHMTQYGSLMGARENIQLQSKIVVLTWVLIVLTVIILIATINTFGWFEWFWTLLF